MSPTEAARIAAVLPLPKKRGAVAPKGFTRRYGNIIAARIPAVARDALDVCIYEGAPAPVNKAPPSVTRAPRPQPGEEYESPKPLPPLQNVVEQLPPPEQQAPAAASSNQSAPPEEQPQEPSNSF